MEDNPEINIEMCRFFWTDPHTQPVRRSATHSIVPLDLFSLAIFRVVCSSADRILMSAMRSQSQSG